MFKEAKPVVFAITFPFFISATALVDFTRVFPFQFCFRQDLQDLQDCFKQVEQEMQESLGPPSAGSGMATPVFLLPLQFSMPKMPHLLYLLFSMLKS